MLGMPLGFTLLGLLTVDRGWPRGKVVVVGLLLLPACALFAATVEFAQLFTLTRHCAVSDMVAQPLGAACGMAVWVLCGQRFIAHARAVWIGADLNAAGRLLVAYVVLLAFIQALPLDLTASPADLYRKLRDDVTYIPFGEFTGKTDAARWEQTAKLLKLVGLYLPVGLLATQLKGRFERWKVGRVALAAVALAACLEAVQLVVKSRSPGVTDVCVGAFAVVAGWYLARVHHEGLAIPFVISWGVVWLAGMTPITQAAPGTLVLESPAALRLDTGLTAGRRAPAIRARRDVDETGAIRAGGRADCGVAVATARAAWPARFSASRGADRRGAGAVPVGAVRVQPAVDGGAHAVRHRRAVGRHGRGAGCAGGEAVRACNAARAPCVLKEGMVVSDTHAETDSATPPPVGAPALTPPAELPVTVIEPQTGWGLPDFRELWRYRELLYFLALRDVKVRYKQTVLGVGWAVAQPLATMAVFALFLGKMAGIASGVEHYPLFVFAGMVAWTFFGNTVTAAAGSVVANERLVTKIYFPRLLIPLGTVGVGVFDLVIASALLAVMAAGFGVAPGWSVLLLPLVVIDAGLRGGGRRRTAVGADCGATRLQVCANVRRAVVDVRDAEPVPAGGIVRRDGANVATAEPGLRAGAGVPAGGARWRVRLVCVRRVVRGGRAAGDGGDAVLPPRRAELRGRDLRRAHAPGDSRYQPDETLPAR